MEKPSRLKEKHLHFAYGWLWGVIVLSLALLVYVGFRDHYFRYWFGSDFKIVDVHEAIQSEEEAGVLFDAMRDANITQTVLVGTPDEIMYYNGETGFSGYEKNNEAVLAVNDSNDSRFIAFCTVDPSDMNALATMQNCVDQGADGFKLYTGHSLFYEKPLDDPSFFPIYQFLSDNNLPVIFHVNSAKYQTEFESVLNLYPDMQVICPHFCLTSKNLQRLSYLFDTYPNFYTDISFGSPEYLLEGLAYISVNADAYREFITKYADRFFYGTDVIVTDYEGKTEEWLTDLFEVYRSMLEDETYTVFLTNDPAVIYNGLHLDYDVLKKIYETNWQTRSASEVSHF